MTELIDLQPHLEGDLVRLRPLRPDDWDALFGIASDPKIWEQHPHHDRHQEAVFRRFFQEALDSGGALAAIDQKTEQIIGSTRMVWHDRAQRVIEIGWTFLARSYWGRKYNAEMKALMLRHVFGFADRVVFIVGSENRRSRKALENIGATLTDRRQRGTNATGDAISVVVYEIVKAHYCG